MLNVWVVLLFLYSIMYGSISFRYIFINRLTAAGIYLVVQMNDDRNLAGSDFDAVARAAGDKANIQIKKGTNLEKTGTRIKDLGISIGFWYLYKALPYPASAIFFLHWQIGLTSFALCAIPSLLAFWAFYHALGNRNYFAKNPAAYEDQTIAEGPIDSEWEDEEESSEFSDDSGEENPLSRRHNDTMPDLTPRQSEKSLPTRRGKSGRRGRVV